MSNLETAPAELTCPGDRARERTEGRVLDSRAVPLGGPRAMTVRRVLPQRAQSLIGAWCFADHYGPDDVSATGGMRVPGHPHTGLQTVSWLFSGQVEHRDTGGNHAMVRPAELNLMTAGSGIAHSEYSTPDTTLLHGAQLWMALPEKHRFVAPGFEHYAPPVVEAGGARVLVFLGSLAGHTSQAVSYSPVLGAEITIPAGHTLPLTVDPGFEHGVLVDTGTVTVADATAGPGQLVYRPTGAHRLLLRAAPNHQARVLLLGGEPLGERIVMWWNFIGRSHEDIVTYREQWQYERDQPDIGAAGRFGRFPTQWEGTLPAPGLPTSRLKLRG